jgi:hypothetical protein
MEHCADQFKAGRRLVIAYMTQNTRNVMETLEREVSEAGAGYKLPSILKRRKLT